MHSLTWLCVSCAEIVVRHMMAGHEPDMETRSFLQWDSFDDAADLATVLGKGRWGYCSRTYSCCQCHAIVVVVLAGEVWDCVTKHTSAGGPAVECRAVVDTLQLRFDISRQVCR